MQPPSVKSKLIPVPHGFYGRDGIPEGIKPVLLTQIHGDVCLTITDFRDDEPQADAFVTTNPDIALAIKTADCAPVLFSAPGMVAAAHAGWGGALKGVLESTVAAMEKLGANRADITAAIGPCIAQKSYEVDADFAVPFTREDAQTERFFKAGRKPGKLMFDLAGYCAYRLARAGILRVDIMGRDTLAEEDMYFSYRRGALRGAPETGRQMSIISLK